MLFANVQELSVHLSNIFFAVSRTNLSLTSLYAIHSKKYNSSTATMLANARPRGGTQVYEL